MSNNYTPPVGQTNYMSGWGSSNNNTKSSAKDIEHTADKTDFAVDMVDNALLAYDSVEKELMEMANASMPPTPEALRALAHRIDNHQQQARMGLLKIKEFQKNIVKSSGTIQQNNGWR
jgi:hypothetical protein